MDTFASSLLPLNRDDIFDGPLMERYLQEKSKPFFETVGYGCPTDMAFAATYQPQYSLTWSSQSYTSAGSASLSPPAESDAMCDATQGPATPEISAPSPPYEARLMSTQQWEGQHLQHAQFTLAYMPPRSRFINPSDINPEHDMTSPDDCSGDLRGMEFSEALFQPTDESAIDPNLLPSGSTQKVTSVISDTNRQAVGIAKIESATADQAIQGPSRNNKARRNRMPKRSNPSHASDKHARGRSSSHVNTEIILPHGQDPEVCKFCKDTFKDKSCLQRHVRSSHRRPFTCVFHYAGCSSTFGAKNEWKRHVLSQHLGLYYWHCTLDYCSQANPLHAQGRASTPGIPSDGSIFNRKDLYTQHVRRMHLSGDTSTKKAFKEVEEKLKIFQEAAKKKRCELPVFMECPAVGCPKEFHGANAWDERMEHVACHLGRAASGKEEDVLFGGDHDLTLTHWAASPEVGVALQLPGGGWQHRNPLKGTGNSSTTSPSDVASASADQDAEGEECGPGI